MGNPNGHLVHGLSNTPIYAVWQTMKQRCNNPKNQKYKWYGAKGVTYCEEWESVEVFYKWCLSNGYEEGLTLDRIDSNGNYEPKNCRFVPISEQQSNKTNTHFIEYNGEIHTLTEWSKILQIPRSTLSNRINALGWSIERALGKEVKT